jgi:hypothetical protein
MKQLLLTLCLIPSISFGQLIISGGATGGGSGDALTSGTLAQFAATTSSQFKGVISDENAPDGASSKVIMALGSLSIASGKTLTGSNTLTLAGTDGTTMTFPTTSTTVVGLTDTQTLTNKRVTPRLNTTADTGSLTVDSDATDLYTVTALAQACTINAPSGTPTGGQRLMIRFKDNGTARGLTFATGSSGQFRASSDLALPTTTTLSKTLYCLFIYNATDSRWDLLAKLDNF